MNRTAFHDAIRSSLFANRLSAGQVQGINAILDSCQRNGVTDPRHVANICAQVYHETGGHMLPIKETVMPYHSDKNPSDATVIARLDAAYAKGQLPWVSKPYWRDGWFGRGPIQITHLENYRKMGNRLGINLVGDRGKALDPQIGADIAVVGMRDGAFRSGHNLDRYFNSVTNDPGSARRIVNGPDGTDAKIADYHRKFLLALQAAGMATQPHKPGSAPSGPSKAEDALVGTGGAALTGLAAWLASEGATVLAIAAGVAVVGLVVFMLWRHRNRKKD